MLPGRRIRIAPHVTLKLLPAPCQVTPHSATGRCATSDAGSVENDLISDYGLESVELDPPPSQALQGLQGVEGRAFETHRSPLRIVIPPLQAKNKVLENADTPGDGITNPDSSVAYATGDCGPTPMTSPLRAGFASLPSVQGPFHLRHLVQNGTFGNAWAAEDESSGRLLCLKVFRSLEEPGLRHSIRSELKVYRRIASSRDGNRGKLFVMELERSMQHDMVVSFAMELMSFDLSTYMHYKSGRCKRNARRWMAQIALGIESLHEMGIMHRDIKAENILVDSRENVRIADFGLAHMETTSLHRWGEYVSEFSGTVQCMAPEILRNKGLPPHRMKRYGLAVDWWALGCLLFELESRGQGLFASEEEVHGYVSWTKRHCRLTQIYPKFEGLAPNVVSLLEGLLRISPSLRYSIQDLERHEYFHRRNGTSEFLNAGARALERPIRSELVPQSMSDAADKSAGSVPRARQHLQYDWKNPKSGVES